MAEHQTKHMDHDSCVAYYRDALSPQQAERVRNYLAIHPEEARRARMDADHERVMAQSQTGVLQEPIPTRLRVEARRPNNPWPSRLALAATIVVSIAVGWWLGGLPGTTDRNTSFTERVMSAAQHPVAQDLTHTVASTPIDVPPPDLSLQGYRLVQQVRLANAEPALVEFVYRNAAGRQLRIYAKTSPERHTAATVTSREGLAMTQWHEGDTRYALVADVPQPALQKLAQAARNDTMPGENMLAGAERQLTNEPDSGNPGSQAQPLPLATDGHIPQAVSDTQAITPVRM